MSTIVAMAPSPAPHDRSLLGGTDLPHPTTSASTSSSQLTPSPSASRATVPPPPPHSSIATTNTTTTMTTTVSKSPAQQQPPPAQADVSPKSGPASAPKTSPSDRSTKNAGAMPKIIVKKEPTSPELPPVRPRPRKLDLSQNTIATSPATGRPVTARDGGLGIQEVGLACLSPGFVTQDPVMKEQLQRSISVREHQRQIIEQRLQQSAKGESPMHHNRDSGAKESAGPFAAKTPGMSRRNKAPPGLSIVAPSHEQFAHERVIQSAPLGQTFTGRNEALPRTRHVVNQPSNLSSNSHIHHVPANQTSNRLPPLADVFGQDLSGSADLKHHNHHHNHHPHHQPPPPPPHSSQPQHFYPHSSHSARAPAPLTSPGHPPPLPHTAGATRPREYKSAEEAQADLAGGRPELLPKLVYYGGHQPPTPPSPPTGHHHHHRGGPATDVIPSLSSGNKRRREEYDVGDSPPHSNGRSSHHRRAPFGDGSSDSPDAQRAKRDEFLQLCARAWDLFHS